MLPCNVSWFLNVSVLQLTYVRKKLKFVMEVGYFEFLKDYVFGEVKALCLLLI